MLLDPEKDLESGSESELESWLKKKHKKGPLTQSAESLDGNDLKCDDLVIINRSGDMAEKMGKMKMEGKVVSLWRLWTWTRNWVCARVWHGH